MTDKKRYWLAGSLMAVVNGPMTIYTLERIFGLCWVSCWMSETVLMSGDPVSLTPLLLVGVLQIPGELFLFCILLLLRCPSLAFLSLFLTLVPFALPLFFDEFGGERIEMVP